jgi:hypothetical protein
LCANKDACLIGTWQPFLHRLPPYGIPDPNFGFVPDPGFKVLQFAITIPDDRPLYAGFQTGVIVEDIHLLDRVSKRVRRCSGTAVIDLCGKLHSLDLNIRLRRDIAFEQCLNDQRDGWYRC